MKHRSFLILNVSLMISFPLCAEINREMVDVPPVISFSIGEQKTELTKNNLAQETLDPQKEDLDAPLSLEIEEPNLAEGIVAEIEPQEQKKLIEIELKIDEAASIASDLLALPQNETLSAEIATESAPIVLEAQKVEEENQSEFESASPSKMIAENEPLVVESAKTAGSAQIYPKAAIEETNAIPLDLRDEESANIQISVQQIFSGSPAIYTVLLLMSVGAVSIWLYTILSLRDSANLSEEMLKNLRNKLYANQYDEALTLCTEQEDLFSKMLASGISARRYGLPVMIESMRAEGKRMTARFWQRTALLNDIAIIAPMIGLLGTVLGMLYAFYDINRSIESVSTLFDGLGISVGTTVAGLFVAILAMVLQSMTKYRLVKLLSRIENETQSFATMIDNHATSHSK